MTDPTPTPDAPDLFDLVSGIIRQHCYPFSDVGIGGISDAAAAIVAALRAERDEAQPVAWLIEQTALDGTTRYAFLRERSRIFGWTADHAKAMRFSRQIDAANAMCVMQIYQPGLFHSGGWERTKAVEHMWIDAHPPATRPGADRPVERALVVVKYAQVLRDKWRTAGQKADSDDFLGAISDVCDAVDQFDFGSGRIERGAASPGAAGDAWPHLTAYGEQTPITVSGQTTVPAPAAAGDADLSDAQIDAAYQAWFIYWTQDCPDQSERQSESRDYCRAAMRKAISAASPAPGAAGGADWGGAYEKALTEYEDGTPRVPASGKGEKS